MSTDVAGELAISLSLRNERVDRVSIESTRPQVAGTLLVGRTVDEALAMVPSVFAICGRSQAIAAAMAVEAARGEKADAVALARRTRAIEAEMAQEYLFHALVEWPKASGGQPLADAFARARDALAREDTPVDAAISGAVEHDVLHGDSGAWYDNEHVPAFEIWIAQAHTPTARMLGAVQRDGPRHGAPREPREVPLLPYFEGMTASRIMQALEEQAGFERTPQLDGHPHETGAMARLAMHPLIHAFDKTYGRSTLTRFAARITELARLAAGRPAARPLLGSRRLGENRGLGWVETARGLLLHAIEIAHDAVRGYRIVAPTEWNFHPRGSLPAGLLGVHALSEDDVRHRADWLIQALDPCVTYRLEITGA